MHKFQPMCKAYYVAYVNGIMPPNQEGGVDNHLIGSIMRLTIQAEILIIKRGSGGHDAYLDAERSQKRQPAGAKHPEPPPRKSHRWTVCTPFLRPTRSGTGQIRDAASGKDRWTGSWGYGNRLWVLASKAVSTSKTLRGRGAKWVVASKQGPPAGSQADRRSLDLYLGYTQGRTRTADGGVARAGGQTIWHLSAFAQYRKGAGTAPKKGLSANAGSEASDPVAVRSKTECARQYEILRRQALEAGENSNGNGLEIALIESRGLAAWISYVPPGVRSVQMTEAETMDCDLILAFAELVLGDRLEEQDDRAD